jgi:hypothetical protein
MRLQIAMQFPIEKSRYLSSTLSFWVGFILQRPLQQRPSESLQRDPLDRCQSLRRSGEPVDYSEAPAILTSAVGATVWLD